MNLINICSYRWNFYLREPFGIVEERTFTCINHYLPALLDKPKLPGE